MAREKFGNKRSHPARTGAHSPDQTSVPLTSTPSQSTDSTVGKMTRVAKATLAASCIISVAIIWGVHYQQSSEREVRVRISHQSTDIDRAFWIYSGG